MIWPGVYDKDHPATLEQYAERLPEIAEALDRFVHLIRFHLAPIVADKRVRERIEAALADHFLNQEGLVGEFQEKGVNYARRRADETPLTLTITSSVHIRGLPRELNV